jgi:hypothetical protein
MDAMKMLFMDTDFMDIDFMTLLFASGYRPHANGLTPEPHSSTSNVPEREFRQHQREALERWGIRGKRQGNKDDAKKGRPAAKGGFQAGQTAKARRGPPCAVTPQMWTWPRASCAAQSKS